MMASLSNNLKLDSWPSMVASTLLMLFQEKTFDLYMSMAKYIDWLTKTISSNKGMHTCNFIIFC